MVRLAPSMTMLITELAKATGEVPGSNPGGPIYNSYVIDNFIPHLWKFNLVLS